MLHIPQASIPPEFSRLNGRMSGLIRFFSRLSACLLLSSATLLLNAQGTRLWTQSQLGEFEKGTAQGVELASDGHLTAGAVARELLTRPSGFVWSVAVGSDGTLYAGTASPASVWRVPVGKDGKAQFDKEKSRLFESKDLTVQALRMGPDGNLYAATLPSGKVYRISPKSVDKLDEAKATVVFDPEKLTADVGKKKSHYVWDLSFDKAGRLYIATGDPAAVYRVDAGRPDSMPEEFFKSDEAHLRTLTWDAQGNLLAGSDGSGLVYRIDAAGKGYVLFAAPRREITALSVDAGTIYAACVGEKNRTPLPPLPLAGAAAVVIAQPASVSAAGASNLLPEGSEIFALSAGQAPRKLWAARDEVVYALASSSSGLLALAGNHGRIFRIQPDGSFAVVAQLDAQQPLSLAAKGDELLIGTGNPGKIFALAPEGAHEFSSQVFDAAVLTRFGHVEVEPGASGYKIFTRTGNVEQPARGWTEWQPLNDGVVVSPAGRFLQWKAVFEAHGSLGTVGVNYLPVNAAPVVDEVVVASGARVNASGFAGAAQTVMIGFAAPQSAASGLNAAEANAANAPLAAIKDRSFATARWAAHDDNGDELIYALYLRGDGESVWRLLKDRLSEKAYSFDATGLPDGGYRLKVVANDAPSHSPADALNAEKISPHFEIDTTPPTIRNLKITGGARNCAQGRCSRAATLVFDAEDASSTLARAEFSLDAGPWQYAEPVGKLTDSRQEHYELKIAFDEEAESNSEHLVTVRVYDRHDNTGLAKTILGGRH